MEWFKHMTVGNEDPAISDAWDEFGEIGYVVYFVLLEIYGKEFNHINNDGFLMLSAGYLERKMRKKWSKISQILQFFEKKEKISILLFEKSVSVKIPRFLEIASNWTKRVVHLPTEATPQEATEPPTAKEKNKNRSIKHTSILNKNNNTSLPKVFEYWNSKKIIVHTTISDANASHINALLKRLISTGLPEEAALQDIIETIDNYADVLAHPDLYFFKYRWTLWDFIARGYDKFRSVNNPKTNYLKTPLGDSKVQKSTEGALEDAGYKK